MTSANELCKVLSHDMRRNILKELLKQPKGICFSYLLSKYDVTSNTICFHIKKLIQADLVYNTGKYHITELGKNVIKETIDLENHVIKMIKNEMHS